MRPPKDLEVTRLRHELRRCVSARQNDEAQRILARLRVFAIDDNETANDELASECDRWAIRLLAS